MIPYSFLDLSMVSDGDNIPNTLKNSVTTAQLAEKVGFYRYWFAEHHNMESITSSATSVLIGHVASQTHTMRIGSGGVMLPNHSPLVIAEHYGTLASLYNDRIDLGLGRAPGTDQLTAHALNPNFFQNVRDFPENVQLLQRYLSKDNQHSKVRAFPGEGTNVPIWILGSSTDSAYLASSLGLPYAFASHFAPAQIKPAFDIYTNNCRTNGFQAKKMAAVNVIMGETNEKAERIATTLYSMFLGLVRNTRGYLPAPVDAMDWTPIEEAKVKQITSCSFIGNKEKVKTEISAFIKEFDLDEIMITSPIYHLEDKLYTIEKFAEVMKEL